MNGAPQKKKGTAIALAAAALTALGSQAASSAPEAGAMTRQQIEQIVHEYILSHPEILPEAMERLNANRTGEVIAQHRKAIETPYGGAWEGAADGDVVLVEFFDYACGYCRAALPDIARLVGEDKKLKVVYRELPILSPLSAEAAKVSLLVARKGNYMAYHKALFGAGRVSRDTIFAAAQAAGIDYPYTCASGNCGAAARSGTPWSAQMRSTAAVRSTQACGARA